MNVDISENVFSEDMLGKNILLEGMEAGDIRTGEDQPLSISIFK